MLRGPSSVRLLLLATLSLSFLGPSLERCRPEYRGVKNHTACLPRNPECKILSSGLTRAEKKSLLDAHNRFRSTVARGALAGFPPASDMQKLQWDDRIAEVAQAHARQCRFRHVAGRLRATAKFRRTGENLASFWKSGATSPNKSKHASSDNDTERAVKMWFDEHRHYSPSRVGNFTQNAAGGPVGHFTQAIWAGSRYIGCGAVLYRKKNSRLGGATRFYVCDYAEAGNHAGKPVYLPGRTCSRCPPRTTCERKTGLCAGGPALGRRAFDPGFGRAVAASTATGGPTWGFPASQHAAPLIKFNVWRTRRTGFDPGRQLKQPGSDSFGFSERRFR